MLKNATNPTTEFPSRQLSTNVSNQDLGPDCWNYSCCRVVVRLICNVLNIEDNENDECDVLYSRFMDFNYEYAKEKCIKNGDSSSYKKILLYFFFYCLGNAIFSCELDVETKKKQLLHESFKYTDRVDVDPEEKTKKYRSSRGMSAIIVYNTFLEDVLNNENFMNHESVENIYKIGLVWESTRMEFETIVYPLISEFIKQTNGNCIYKSIHCLNQDDVIEKKTKEEKREELENLFSHGLYASINVNLGDDEYIRKFSNYIPDPETGQLPIKPYAGFIKNKKEGGHGMTIVEYNNIKDNEMLKELIIKNSWGKEWGNNGTIKIFSSELIGGGSFITWIEPADFKVLKQTKEIKTVDKEPRENLDFIYEDFNYVYHTKILKLLEVIFNGEEIDSKKFKAFFKTLTNINIYKDKINNIFKEINDNNDVNINAQKLALFLLFNFECVTYEFDDLREAVLKKINEPNYEDSLNDIKTQYNLELETTSIDDDYEFSPLFSDNYRIFIPYKEEHALPFLRSLSDSNLKINKERLKKMYFNLVGDDLFPDELEEIIHDVNGNVADELLDVNKLNNLFKTFTNKSVMSVKLQKLRNAVIVVSEGPNSHELTDAIVGGSVKKNKSRKRRIRLKTKRRKNKLLNPYKNKLFKTNKNKCRYRIKNKTVKNAPS